jgi:ATP-dependent DNA ligase
MSEIKVQICLFGFDLLYFNGQVSVSPHHVSMCYLKR